MRLWEINEEIARLTEQVEYSNEYGAFVDQETGEIMSEEEFDGFFDKLQMNKHEILEWLAKEVINMRSDAKQLKAEEDRLKERREKIEKKTERFIEIIARECHGEKTDLGVATVSFRKSEAVTWDPLEEDALLLWLMKNGHDDCIKRADPEVKKTELKKLLKGGAEVPFARVEQRTSASVK